jgi:pimeloyl-ACP methyl ester carboxylesterase
MVYQALPQLARLRAPTVIMARSDDVLYSHLDRLPDLPACCSLERLGPDRDAWRARLRAILAAHLGQEPSPPPPQISCDQASTYLDLPHGQVRLRRLGRGGGVPILYLHETPGGAGAAMDELCALAHGRSVVAPDLPGCGESDPLAEPTIDGYAAVLEAVVAAAGGAPVDVIAQATATPLALRLMARSPGLVRRAALDAALLPGAAERAALAAAYCPPLGFESSGAHLHRAWHMVRDQAVHWPWYDTARAEAVRRFPGSLGAPGLHRRFLDVLTQMEHYGDAVAAALAQDARRDLRAITAPVLVFESDDPRDRWARTASELCASVELTPRPAGRAEVIGRVLVFLDRP